MSFILKLLGGSFGSWIAGGIAAVLALSMASCSVQTARLNHAKADLTAAKAALRNPATHKTWQSEAMRDGKNLVACHETTANLTASLNAQTASLKSLRAESDAKLAEASRAVRSALQGQHAADAKVARMLRSKPQGADVCARWSDADRIVVEGIR